MLITCPQNRPFFTLIFAKKSVILELLKQALGGLLKIVKEWTRTRIRKTLEPREKGRTRRMKIWRARSRGKFRKLTLRIR
jgi:hypothetical protein